MKFKNVASSGKTIATVSRDEKDVILMHLLPGTAVNSYCIIGTLRSLIAAFVTFFPQGKC
jgi:hydrogenase maturation factor